MALGPMSTPRRSCPRSMGTPKIPTGLRLFSDKGGASRTSRVCRRFEASFRRSPDRIDPAEEHVRGLVGQHTLVVVEVRRAGASLVGEEVTLSVEARREYGLFQHHPEIEHVYDRLQYGCGYARGARRPERDDAAFLCGDDGRAHVGDQTLPRRERVEASGVELGLAQRIVHGYPRGGYHET